MRDRPLVSVAMCTYNGARFLKEQLDSLLGQSYKNIEIVVTDDGSTDDSVSLIKTYAAAHDNIRLFENDINLGFVKNFEKAISLCRGDYIALADQDDIWECGKIEHFVEAIGEHEMIYSDATLIDADSKPINRLLIGPDRQLVSGHCFMAFIFDNCVSGNTLMFRKELVSKILPIPEGVKFHDQWIAFVASACGTITAIDEPQTRYRRYSDQVTHTVKVKAKGLVKRVREKLERKKRYASQQLQFIEALATVDSVSVQITFKMLIDHFQNYQGRFFNMRLFIHLWKIREALFAIEPSSRKRMTAAFKVAVGFRLYAMSLGSL